MTLQLLDNSGGMERHPGHTSGPQVNSFCWLDKLNNKGYIYNWKLLKTYMGEHTSRTHAALGGGSIFALMRETTVVKQFKSEWGFKEAHRR